MRPPPGTVAVWQTGGGGGTTPPPSGNRGAYAPIEAESYDQQSGLATEATSDIGGGQDVGWAANGDWALYKGVDFGSTAATQFNARVASGAADVYLTFTSGQPADFVNVNWFDFGH